MSHCKYCGMPQRWISDDEGAAVRIPCECGGKPKPRPPAPATAGRSISHRPDAERTCPDCKALIPASEWVAHAAWCRADNGTVGARTSAPKAASGAGSPSAAGAALIAFDSLLGDGLESPEWRVVQEVIAQSRTREPQQWGAFAGCQAVEIYTDGSAPVRNPGGPAGFAAVVVGFATTLAPGAEDRPPTVARLDLGGFVPARDAPPATTNNRVEIAGIMAAWAALPHLASGPWTRATVRIFSDSDYAVSCGAGTYKRKKNTDLWPIYDMLAAAARLRLDCEARVLWVKGHAGNVYNATADELATQAAFNFDAAAYQNYRAAQAVTGREMPGARAIERSASAQPGGALAPPSAARTRWPLPAAWHMETDYAVALHTGAAGVGGGSSGVYRVANKHGRAQDIALPALRGGSVDAVAYAALVHALSDLSARITTARSETHKFTVTVFTCQQVVARQLAGGYRVLSPEMQGPHADARKLIDRFARVEIVYKPAAEIKSLFAERL